MLVNFEKSVTLTISERAQLEHQLDAAVARLFEPAKELHQGILVNRLSPEQFIVSVSEDVPYGIIVENVSW